MTHIERIERKLIQICDIMVLAGEVFNGDCALRLVRACMCPIGAAKGTMIADTDLYSPVLGLSHYEQWAIARGFDWSSRGSDWSSSGTELNALGARLRERYGA